jgi:hypothetical protein
MKTLTQRVQNTIRLNNEMVVTLKAKLEENYLHSFTWGYQDEVYKNLRYTRRLQVIERELLDVEVDNDMMVGFLNNEVKELQNGLMFGGQSLQSSNAASNLAYALDREVSSKYLRFLNDMVREYTDESGEITLK